MAMFGATKIGGAAMTRSRWAAIGAAVAVTLGAGGIGFVAAAPSEGGPVLVSITPCRLVDTRPETGVGPRRAALGPDETYTFATTGDQGDCTGIPADAVALSMNVTGVGATDPTFFTVFPAGATRPDASSLNLSSGAATPNAVVSGLGDGGQLSIYNLQGSAHVIVDVNGYYVDHDHDDRYVRLRVGEEYLHGGTFSPVGTTAWTQSIGTAWSHAASANQECLTAPVELAVGTPVTGMRLVYTATASVSVTIGFYVFNRHPGPLLVEPPITASQSVPASPPGQVAEAIIPITTPTTTVDATYTALICTIASFAVIAAAVRLE